jgi:RNA polymerase-binding transcription factor DksA
MTGHDARRKQLEDRLKELDARLHRIEDTLETPHDEDFGDMATEREEEEVLEDLGVAGQQEIRMIRAALKRIEDGTYGVCVNCGDEISAERLDVVPHAPRCRDCAA